MRRRNHESRERFQDGKSIGSEGPALEASRSAASSRRSEDAWSLGPSDARTFRANQRLEIADRLAPPRASASSSVVWNASSSAIISSTRSSELRPSSSSVVSVVSVRPAAKRATTSSTVAAGDRAGAARRAALGPALQLLPLELLRAFGARQRVARPDRRAPDALMIFEPRVGAAHDRVDVARPARARAPRECAPRRRRAGRRRRRR